MIACQYPHCVGGEFATHCNSECVRADAATRAAINAAVLAEREACARVCDARFMGDNNREDAEARRCAAAIRARKEPVQEPQCNPHPKAPHGFLRNASHNEDRYVCECEGWEPYEAGYQAGMEAALAEPVQEPVAWMVFTLDGKSVCVTDNPADFTDEHKALPLYIRGNP